MELLEREKVILESQPFKSFSFMVTNFRIRWEANEDGHLQMTSIMLESLTSIDLSFRQNFSSLIYGMMMLIILAGTGTLVGESMNDTDIINIGWYGGLACMLLGVIMYFPTRQYQVTFSSPSAFIRINVKGLDQETIRDMIETVEDAKVKRNKQLSTPPPVRPAPQPQVVRKIIKKSVTPNTSQKVVPEVDPITRIKEELAQEQSLSLEDVPSIDSTSEPDTPQT